MIESNSATWEHIKKWAESQIASLQTELEEKGLSEVDTEYLRGRIASIRVVLDLGVEKHSSPTVSTEYFD